MHFLLRRKSFSLANECSISCLKLNCCLGANHHRSFLWISINFVLRLFPQRAKVKGKWVLVFESEGKLSNGGVAGEFEVSVVVFEGMDLGGRG